MTDQRPWIDRIDQSRVIRVHPHMTDAEWDDVFERMGITQEDKNRFAASLWAAAQRQTKDEAPPTIQG